MKLSELIGQGLVGGTLVEYEKGYGFLREFGRAVIKSVGFKDAGRDYFEIETNGEVHLGQSLAYYGDTEIELIDDVYLWDSALGWCYALARAGIEIPGAPAMELRYELRGR